MATWLPSKSTVSVSSYLPLKCYVLSFFRTLTSSLPLGDMTTNNGGWTYVARGSSQVDAAVGDVSLDPTQATMLVLVTCMHA